MVGVLGGCVLVGMLVMLLGVVFLFIVEGGVGCVLRLL